MSAKERWASLVRLARPALLRARAGLLWLIAALGRGARAAWAALVALARRFELERRLRRLGRWLAGQRRRLVAAGLLAGVVLATGGLLLMRVPPGVVAVRQVNWGPGSGIVPRDHGPGLAFGLFGRDTWHLVPSGVQSLHFGWENVGGTEPMLAVATRGGEAAQVEVVVPFRVRAGEAHRLVADGLEDGYRARATAIARRVLLEELGQLAAEDWFDTERRAAAQAASLERLAAELAVAHLEPLAVLVGDVYLDGAFEKKMIEKQLAALTERTNRSIAAQAAAELAKQRALHDLSMAEKAAVLGWDQRQEEARLASARAVADVERDSAAQAARLRFEADAAHERLVADGDLALARAEATRQSLEGAVLEGAGGRLHLAKRAAENLRIQSVTLDSRDPRVPSVLDLDALVDLLIGKTGDD